MADRSAQHPDGIVSDRVRVRGRSESNGGPEGGPPEMSAAKRSLSMTNMPDGDGAKSDADDTGNPLLSFLKTISSKLDQAETSTVAPSAPGDRGRLPLLEDSEEPPHAHGIWGWTSLGSERNGQYVALPTSIPGDEDEAEGNDHFDPYQSEMPEAVEGLPHRASDSVMTQMESFRYQVKLIVDGESTGIVSQLFQSVIFTMIVSSVSAAILETVPELEHSPFLNAAEPVFTFLFSVEIALRVWTADTFRSYLTIFNAIDIMATLPGYTDLILVPLAKAQGSKKESEIDDVSNSLQALRLVDLMQFAKMIRLLRVIRVANTLRQNEMISIVLRSVWGSLSGIWVLLTFMTVGMTLSATTAYILEVDQEDTGFVSIPASMWWAATTITAVGYGDLIPGTVSGKLVAAVTMYLGVVIMAICIAVVTNSFTIQFQRELYHARIKQMQRKMDLQKMVNKSPQVDAQERRGSRFDSLKHLRSSGSQETPERGVPRKESRPVMLPLAMTGRGSLADDAVWNDSTDMAACVTQLEEMSDALMLSFEALIDANPDVTPHNRLPDDDVARKAASLTLEFLRKSNKVWFEQARAFSEHIIVALGEGMDNRQRRSMPASRAGSRAPSRQVSKLSQLPGLA